MTITTLPARNEFTAAAGQTIFNYTFKIFSITDLNVYITPTGQIASDSTDLTTAYTVLGVGDEDGGTITLTTGTSLNDLVTIVSNTPSSRTVDYQNNGDFRPTVVNDDFDRVVSLVKKIEDSTNRSLLTSQSKQGPKPLSLPEPIVGELLRWKDDLTGLENISLSELPTGTFPVDRLALNYSTLAAWQADTSAQLDDVVTTKERSTGNGGGGTGDVISGTGTANGFDKVAHSTLSLTWVLRVGMVIDPVQWGAIDGNDNTAVLESIDSILTSFSQVDLGSIEYVISKTGLPADAFGHRIFDVTGKDGITIKGSRARVTVTNHNVATNGGITFIFAKDSNGLYVRGIDSDMSFTGINTSSSFYPQCALVRGDDGSDADAGGVRTQAQLNGNWWIDDCTFKHFHTSGQFAQSGAAFAGDPNNGFKIFTVVSFGPFDALNYTNQPRKIVIEKCTLKEGGNSYGFWAWAWNDVTMTKCTAESFVAKQSDELGVLSGRGEPMMRYHQFHCEGFKVIDNHFRAKPCSERTVAGFEGDARFVDYNTNLLGNFGHGGCTITGNTIVGGRGDAANSLDDFYMFLIAYGSISITGNTFQGTSETTNAFASVGILWNAESVGGQGNATLAITGNTWNAECDFMDNISISNGATTAANRRLKSLVITDNSTLGQFQYFVKQAITNTAFGVQDTKISNNLISGEFNTKFDKNDSNSRGIELSGSESTDVLDVSKNTIRDKFFGIETNGYAGEATADYNKMIGVTTRYTGSTANIITADRLPNAPTEANADTSVYYRTNGITANVLHVREAGAWVVVG